MADQKKTYRVKTDFDTTCKRLARNVERSSNTQLISRDKEILLNLHGEAGRDFLCSLNLIEAAPPVVEEKPTLAEETVEDLRLVTILETNEDREPEPVTFPVPVEPVAIDVILFDAPGYEDDTTAPFHTYGPKGSTRKLARDLINPEALRQAALRARQVAGKIIKALTLGRTGMHSLGVRTGIGRSELRFVIEELVTCGQVTRKGNGRSYEYGLTGFALYSG
jgi:hypothetical protein